METKKYFSITIRASSILQARSNERISRIVSGNRAYTYTPLVLNWCSRLLRLILNIHVRSDGRRSQKIETHRAVAVSGSQR